MGFLRVYRTLVLQIACLARSCGRPRGDSPAYRGGRGLARRVGSASSGFSGQ